MSILTSNLNAENKAKNAYCNLMHILGISQDFEYSEKYVANELKSYLFARYKNQSVVDADIVDCKGISSGYAYGKLISPKQYELCSNKEKNRFILVSETGGLFDLISLEDVDGLIIINGTTSCHAAIIARSMQIPAILVNNAEVAADIMFNLDNGCFCSIDGTFGKLSFKKIEPYNPSNHFIDEIKRWNNECDQILSEIGLRRISLMANADNSYEAKTALSLGVVGIGSCRIEHMFIDNHRISAIQGMLLLSKGQLFNNYCCRVENIINKELFDMLSETAPRPFTIRLLDALPSEFLPAKDEDIEFVSKKIGISKSEYQRFLDILLNDLGMEEIRGCRLGVVREQTYITQINAIFKSVKQVLCLNKNIDIRIIIPFVSNMSEIDKWSGYINEMFKPLKEKYKGMLSVRVGSMIEIPRAAIISDQIAKQCEVFTYGTNDLTQFTYAKSRNNSNIMYDKLCNTQKIFQEIDFEGVGRLIESSIKCGRQANKDLIIGICGEHVNNVESLKYFVKLDVDYVSCIPGNALYIHTLLNYIYLQNYCNFQRGQ